MEGISNIASPVSNPRQAAMEYSIVASGFSQKRAAPAPATPEYLMPAMWEAEPAATSDIQAKPVGMQAKKAATAVIMQTAEPIVVKSTSAFMEAATAYQASGGEGATHAASTANTTPSTTTMGGMTSSAATTASVYNTVAAASNSTIRGVSVSVVV